VRALSAIRWMLVAVLVAMLIVPVLWTLVTRQDFVKVDGKSMEPVYSVGDVILVGPATQSDFAPGHIITVRNDAGELYTHRVVTVDTDGNAQLKGDGNAFEDPGTVTFSSVEGAVRHHIDQPYANAFLLLATWPARISVLVLILGLMFIPLVSNKNTDEDDSAERAHETPDRDDPEDPSRTSPRSDDPDALASLGLEPAPVSSAAAVRTPEVSTTRHGLRSSARYRRHNTN
jgi:signal peptidase I